MKRAGVLSAILSLVVIFVLSTMAAEAGGQHDNGLHTIPGRGKGIEAGPGRGEGIGNKPSRGKGIGKKPGRGKGIGKKSWRGKGFYKKYRQSYDFYEDLLVLVAKSTGIGLALRKNRTKLDKVKFAMLSGKFVRRLDRTTNDVDLLIVGEIVMPELNLIIQKEEQRVKTEINYTVMAENEFIFRKSRRDPFLLNILSKSRVMIIGDEEGLVDKASTDEE